MKSKGSINQQQVEGETKPDGQMDGEPDGQTPSSLPEYSPFYHVVKLKHDMRGTEIWCRRPPQGQIGHFTNTCNRKEQKGK